MVGKLLKEVGGAGGALRVCARGVEMEGRVGGRLLCRMWGWGGR